ncbi:MAG: cobaltochelatase subunit CobN [Methylovirgula sp.]
MHLLRTTTRLIDESESAVDLGQTPAQFVFLSFSDSDLGVVAAALECGAGLNARLAPLFMLKHPYSIDLYIERIAAKARFVLVRLLGGLDYWRYGAEELSAAARKHGFALATVSGDSRHDPRLDELSTLPSDILERIWAIFEAGGEANIRHLLGWISEHLRGEATPLLQPAPVPAAGLFPAGCRAGPIGAPLAVIIFYRAYLFAGDIAPILACADALAQKGARVLAVSVTSLKDRSAAQWLSEFLARERPDVILNSTGFAARTDADTSPLETADAPIFQLIHAGSSRRAWENDPRGLSAADIAMNVVLPEIDGRIITRTISFKEETARSESLEFTRLVHRPEHSRIGFVADLALAWANLRRRPRAERKLACILSDYPAKAGRAGYAVGLDTPASLAEIGALLGREGYSIDPVADANALMRELAESAPKEAWPLADYLNAFSALPATLRDSVTEVWGTPDNDPLCDGTMFRFRALRLGTMLVAVQPDRARSETRKASYHDAALPPCHGYIAFYLWLRHSEAVDAIIQLGTHGTLEWLPGKAMALSEACAPEALLGPTPLIYPFIVNNPGEAAQAKRRSAAVIISHLTPPLGKVESFGDLATFEALFDEYAAAQEMDPKRAAMLSQIILERATEAGLAQDCGAADLPPSEALARLDGWLCDIKDMRIAEGLHVFGRAPASAAAIIAGTEAGPEALARLDACPARERQALIAALDGRFVAPGPAGAPARGRLDVLPTGRNLFTIDPRAVPTRTGFEIGRRAADVVLARHLQDHGDWPRRIVMDLWGSATMRTGGEELAQIFAFLGAAPLWDNASARVIGFTILPPAALEHPRIDVTLRLSGLFRDVFPSQIALIEQMIGAIAGLDEDAATNLLAAAGENPIRIFGAAPGSYGLPLGRMLSEDAHVSRKVLGEAYLSASGHAQGAAGDRADGKAEALFRDRIACADAFIHVQDLPGQDMLDSSVLAEHEAGFAAAADILGAKPAFYHLDTTRTDVPTARTFAEEIARVVRGRAANPAWIEGQMRHGYRGAAEIAETVENLYAFAVMTDAVSAKHFDLVFEATLGNDAVLAFLEETNPQAARAIAERFNAALARGFWSCRRNSAAMRLSRLLEPPA